MGAAADGLPADLLAEARAAWLSRAVATGPVSLGAVGSALGVLHAHAGLPSPVVVGRPSPAAGARAAHDLAGAAPGDPGTRQAVGRLVVDLVIGGSLGALDRSLAQVTTERTRELLDSEVTDWLGTRLQPLRTLIGDAVARLFGRPPRVPMPGQSPMFPEPWEHVLTAWPGHLGLERVAMHHVARRLGLDHGPATPLLDALMVLSEAGWAWTFEHLAIVCQRPTGIMLDPLGRPHGPHGPALAWPDGFGLWCWHGQVVPRHALEVENLTVAQIMAERNAEVRRVMIERYGTSRFRRDAGARMVHHDRWGRLWRVPLPGDEPLVTVEVVNATPEPDGRHRLYELRVPPTMRTALGAVAWTFGMTPRAYARRMRRET